MYAEVGKSSLTALKAYLRALAKPFTEEHEMTVDPTPADDALLSLAASHCRPGAPKLADADLATHLAALPGWSRHADRLEKSFAVADYHETIGFVNALAWIANREDHHPDLQVGYNRCTVAWSTHDAGGITRNDVVCAAKTDRLVAS
jgi:4a-hydroxytetrahydrobiopterin dehydratase